MYVYVYSVVLCYFICMNDLSSVYCTSRVYHTTTELAQLTPLPNNLQLYLQQLLVE